MAVAAAFLTSGEEVVREVKAERVDSTAPLQHSCRAGLEKASKAAATVQRPLERTAVQ